MNVIGAKKGQKASRTPVIQKDTAQSKAFIQILYGLSEGEIQGLANGLRSIYLDDTPLLSEQGVANFQDVSVDFRTGTNDQAVIDGFSDIKSETQVGVELTQARPWVKAFTNLELNAVSVRLRFAALRSTNPQNGDVSGTTVEYAIDVMTDGTAWVQYGKYKISDKTSSAYEKSHRIALPIAKTGWQIRVRRLTPDNKSDHLSNQSYIQAYTEIIDAKMTYPNTALLALRYDAEAFSNVAKIAIECEGIKIQVPSNYDPVSRQYHGLWDGTFKIAYTNNPAWHFYDVCVAGRYALGERIRSDMIDKWSVYRLGQYCDEMVSDGKGGQEPRFTLNVYEQSQDDAWALLSKMAGAFRAFIYWDGQAIVLDADMPQDTHYTYTRANVIDGQFEYTGTRARDRHTVAKVAWDNPQNRYKTEYVTVRDEQGIADLGVRMLDISAYGCTSEAQAQRAGLWALKSEQLETRTVSFKVGLDGYIPQCGKVIEIADELFAGRANGGRIVSVNAKKDEITLDRDDVIAKAGDRIVINNGMGKAEARVIHSVTGRVVRVVSAFESVESEHIWVVDSRDLATMKFRVLSISQDEQHQFTIQAIQYNPAKYQTIDSGTMIDERPISVLSPKEQEAVSNVRISAEYMQEQGLNIATLVIDFDQAIGATKYLVEWRKDDGNWQKIESTTNSVTVKGVYSGKYQAKVTAINAFNAVSLATYSEITPLKGKAGKPAKLASFNVVGMLFGMNFGWTFPANADDSSYTEVQVSPDGRTNITTLAQFAYPTDTHQIQGLQGDFTQFYRARLVDKLGNMSDWTDWVSATTSSDPQAVLDILQGQIDESILNQALSNKINTAVHTGTENQQSIQQANQAIAQEAQRRTDAIRAETTARTQAIQAESNARTQAINAEIRNRTDAINSKATEVRNAITPQITALQQGLSQETQQRQTADAQTLSALNAYKLSNDSALAVVLNKADTAIRENASQASQLTALNSAIQTANQQIATKLNASAIQNYYTKTETDNAVTGKINEFNASLNIGGVNVLPNSHVEKTSVNEHLYYAVLPALKEFYLSNPVVTISFDLSVPITGNVSVYSSNNSGVYFMASVTVTEANIFKRYSVTVNPVRHSATPDNPNGTLEFYGIYKTGRIPTVKNVKIESGNKATAWTPALSDVGDKINANAQAIQNINSSVTNINGTLTSQSGQIAQFRTDLNKINQNLNLKADASALSTLDSTVRQQGTQITSQSSKITQLENNLNATNQNLATKANATTVSILDNRVTQVDNRVTAESQKLTQLTSTVNQNQANLVAQYYTKADADNMASGKIEQYKASLDSESLAYDYLSNHADSWVSFYPTVNLANDIQTVNDGKVSKTVYRKTASQPNSWNYNLKGLPNNQRYKLSMWVRRSTDSVGGCYFTALLRNSNEAFDSRTANYTSHTLTIPTDNQWHLISAIVDFSQRPFDIVHFGFSINHTGRAGQAEMQGFKVEKVLSINDVDSSFASSQALSNLQNTVTRQGTTLDSQSSQITQLRNDLTTNLNTKANSSALDSLDSRVRQQGQDISVINTKTTQLESGVNSINQSLATKANTSAVSNLESRVGNIDGRVNSQAGQITRLESGLDTKANITALSNYYTRAETDNVIGGKVEEFKATLDNTSLLPDPNMTDVNSWLSHYNYDFRQYLKTITDGKVAPTVFRKDTQHSACWNYSKTSVPNNRSYKLSAWVRRSNDSVGSMYFTYRYLKAEDTQFIHAQYGNSNNITNRVPADGNWHFVSVIMNLTDRADIAKIFFGFALGHAQAGGWWELQGFRCESVLSSNDIDNSIATSNALQQTNTNVTRIDGTLLSQGQSITKLTNDLATTNSNLSRKAESTAVTDLSNRVTQQGTQITSQASKLTQLESSLNTVNQGLNQKANATALNNLESTVNNINGRVNAQASQYSTLQSTVNGQTTTIQQQTQSINGVKAMHVFKMDVNGVISGWGMMSDVQNGRVNSQFGINADEFFIGPPSNGKKPFIFNTSPRMIDGIQYPVGIFLNGSIIATSSISGDKITANTEINAPLIRGGQIDINGKFLVNKLGEVNATAGKIGGIVLTSNGLRSANYIENQSGFSLEMDGSVKINNPLIVREQRVASGEKSFGAVNFIHRSGQYIAGYAEGRETRRPIYEYRWNGYGWYEIDGFYIDTGVSIEAWDTSKNCYQVMCGIKRGSGTWYVVSNSVAEKDRLFGVSSEILPLTRWSGQSTIWLNCRVILCNMTHTDNLVITWHLYKLV